MKIYTKKGDNGNSELLGKGNISKSSIIFEVLGTLDELNATLGFVQTYRSKNIKKICLNIQNELFTMGASFAGKPLGKNPQKEWEARIVSLEEQIDAYDSKNTPLKNFILPGGSNITSQLHLARAVCRRLERKIVFLGECEKTDELFKTFQTYINRLSDLLFVLARYTNKKLGVKDILWESDTIDK